MFIITQIDQKGDVVMTWKIPWLELLRRFLGRNAGFLGTQTAANSDLMEEGLVKGTVRVQYALPTMLLSAGWRLQVLYARQ